MQEYVELEAEAEWEERLQPNERMNKRKRTLSATAYATRAKRLACKQLHCQVCRRAPNSTRIGKMSRLRTANGLGREPFGTPEWIALEPKKVKLISFNKKIKIISFNKKI